jgi:hypothetical protein
VDHNAWKPFSERIKDQPLTEKCYECGKAICDEEWVTCWGYCDNCLSKSLEDYDKRLKERKENKENREVH